MPEPTLAAFPCELCGADAPRHVRTEHGFDICRCRRCGLLYVNPRPLRAMDGDVMWYEDESGADWSLAQYDHLYAWQARELDRFAPRRGRLLDVGCGFGFFLDQARRAGWEVSGIDVSGVATAYARDHLGLGDIRTEELRPETYPAGSFDAATMWNLLEHLDHPLATLRQVAGTLAPGGVLGLRVPNMTFWNLMHRVRPLVALVGHGDFPCLAAPPPGHLYGFTPRTLARILERAGFDVLSIGPTPLSRLYAPALKLAAGAGQQVAAAVSFGRVQLSPTLAAWARLSPRRG